MLSTTLLQFYAYVESCDWSEFAYMGKHDWSIATSLKKAHLQRIK